MVPFHVKRSSVPLFRDTAVESGTTKGDGLNVKCEQVNRDSIVPPTNHQHHPGEGGSFARVETAATVTVSQLPPRRLLTRIEVTVCCVSSSY